MNDNMKARTTLELTVSPNYVRNWGIWESLRELIQNALDARDLGATMDIDYRDLKSGSTLVIESKGTTLDRKVLLLGETSKAFSPGQRGQFGEGFKLAWLVLLRMGYGIKCKSGGEMWEPEISTSSTYGADLLKVQVRPAKYENVVRMYITGVNSSDWNMVKSRVIDLADKKPSRIAVGDNYILTDPEQKGFLYCKGLYVSRLHGNYSFGYDLADIELDRDRRVPDAYSLRYSISGLMERAVTYKALTPEMLWDLAKKESEEFTGLAQSYQYQTVSNELTQEFKRLFLAEYGENATPVSSITESMEAEHYGLKGVPLAMGVRVILEKELGAFDKVKKAKGTDIKKRYTLEDLTQEQQANLQWALTLLCQSEPYFNPTKVNVVDFQGPTLSGLFVDGEILLASKILDDGPELLSTLVHEFAHNEGQDGSMSHERRIESILSAMVFRLSGGEEE